jgi:hypothetical protein
MNSEKNSERRRRRERGENCVSPLLFSTERPTANACWGKRWGTSLFVFKLTLDNLHFFSDYGIFLWSGVVVSLRNFI